MPITYSFPCQLRRSPGRATLHMPQYWFGFQAESKLEWVLWCLRSGFTLFLHSQGLIDRCKCLLPTSRGRSCRIHRALRSRLRTMRRWLHSKSWLFAHPSGIRSSLAHALCCHVGHSRARKSQRWSQGLTILENSFPIQRWCHFCTSKSNEFLRKLSESRLNPGGSRAATDIWQHCLRSDIAFEESLEAGQADCPQCCPSSTPCYLSSKRLCAAHRMLLVAFSSFWSIESLKAYLC